MSARRRFVTRIACRCSLASFAFIASCGADERGLSFELGTSMGSATTGASSGDDSAGASGKGGKGGTSSSTPDAGGENAGGAAGGADGTPAAGALTTTAGSNTGGSGGNGSSGNPGIGGSALSGSGGQPAVGEAGAAGAAPFDGPCGDLNHNLVDDCTETLVHNSRFDTATTGWAPEGSLEQTWVTTNAKPGGASGSLSLRNTTFIAGSMVTAGMGSRQCLVAWGDDTYELAARVFIKPGQGSGSAAISLVFYGSDGCDGTVLDGKTAASVSAVDAWKTARGQVKMPAGTRSVWVRLVVAKPLAQSSFEALFDDVLVTKK
jgi:hypothetical protein